MRKNLFSGLIILLPVAITLWIFIFFIDLLTDPFVLHVQNFFLVISNHHFTLASHALFLTVISRILILILLFLLIILLGYLGKKLFFNWVVKQFHIVILRIPLINSIYKVCRDIISALFSDDKKVFERVVAVPFPCSESKTLGLVAGLAPKEIQDKLPSYLTQEPMKVVFIATSPHPTSGFLLLTHEHDLISLNISLEDAFKFLISCGIFVPGRDQK